MKRRTADWLEIGRSIGRNRLYRSPNIQARRRFLAEEAEALKKRKQTHEVLSVHTIQRFVNVAEFVDSRLDYDVEWSSFSIAVLEIVMRVSKIKPDAARSMLADLTAGRLTFRAALKRESDLREVIPSETAHKPQRGAVDGGPRMRAVVRSALKLSKDELLVQANPKSDWRFPLVKSHAVFLGPRQQSASVFCESMLVSTANPWRPFQEMLGNVFGACSLFKVVVVWLLGEESADELLGHCERSESKPHNLFLVVGPRLVRRDFPSAENS
jgi:hypothetical protein